MQKTVKRVALVTGAGRGIGYEIAEQLARKDLTVVLGVREEEKGVTARDRMVEQGLDAHFVRLDVQDPVAIKAALGRIMDAFERLDVLVNNAGIMIDGQTSILKLEMTQLRDTLETNTIGPLLLSQACIAIMQKHDYGRIVNISSTLGSLAEIVSPDSSHSGVKAPSYRLSKTLLNGLTALLARELRGSNILVNSVCPGWVRTEMGGPRAPVSPQEAAKTPVWLATLPDDGPTGGFFRNRRPIAW